MNSFKFSDPLHINKQVGKNISNYCLPARVAVVVSLFFLVQVLVAVLVLAVVVSVHLVVVVSFEVLPVPFVDDLLLLPVGDEVPRKKLLKSKQNSMKIVFKTREIT